MGFPIIPPDTRAPGYSGHIEDHNAISDSLNAHQSAITNLQGAIPGSIVLSTQQTSNYTIQLTDLGTVVEVNSATPVTVTIPPSSQVGFPVGAIVWICATGTGQVTINPATGAVLLSAATPPVYISSQYGEAKLRQHILNSWVVTGSIA